MIRSECPAAAQARFNLARIREELAVWRHQPDPAISDPRSAPSLWVGRVEALEDDEADELDHLRFLDAHVP